MKTIGSDPYSRKPSHNPFEAPRARVDDPGPAGSGALRAVPRAVETGRGLGWLGDGWRLFKEAPGTWIGILLVWILISLAISLIPVVNLLSNLINPVLIGGMMYGCHSLAQGRGLLLGHLFEGFQRQFGALMLIGLASLIGTILAVGGAFLAVLGASGAFSAMLQQSTAAASNPLTFLLAVLVALALLLPLFMALWFAPALTILHGQRPLQAMALSFQGCLRNMLPFLAYGLGGLGLALLATLPFGLGWLVLVPVLVGSTYAAYLDIFVD
jgi:hypothetical protein